MRRFACLLPVLVALSFAPRAARALPEDRPAVSERAHASSTLAPRVERASTPIELPDAPARPSKDELVGGLVEVVVTLMALGVILVTLFGLIVLIDELTHHHLLHDCEERRHRPPPPPPPFPLPPPPPFPLPPPPPWDN